MECPVHKSKNQRADGEFLEQWFHIPRKHFPLDHYQLLGVERGEQDRETIVQAAKLRVATLRQVKDQSQSDNVKAAYKQVMAAANCLCNAKQRAAYNLRLDQRESSTAGQQRTQRAALSRKGISAEKNKTVNAPRHDILDLDMPLQDSPVTTLRGQQSAGSVATAGWLSKREWLFLGFGMGGMFLIALVAILVIVIVMKSDSGQTVAQTPAIEESNSITHTPNEVPSDDNELNPEHSPSVASSMTERFLEVPSEHLSMGPEGSQLSIDEDETPAEPSAGENDSSHPTELGDDTSLPTNPLDAGTPMGETTVPGAVAAPSSLALETEVELPNSDMISKDSQGESVSLGTVPASLIDILRLDLDSKYVDLNGFHRFELRTVEESTARWEVMLIKHKVVGKPRPEVVDKGIDFEVPVAFISSSDEELLFSWNSQNTWAFGENRDKKFAGQMSNCILLVQHTGMEHAIHLRHLEKSPPLVLKLEERREQIQLVLRDLPPHETLALKITEFQEFEEPTEIIPSDGRVGLDERGRIEVFVGEDQQIRLRLDAEANEDGVGIAFSPFFKSGTKYKPLTPKDAKQELLIKQRQLAQSVADLAQAKRNLANAKALLDRLGPPPNDPKKTFEWRRQVGNARTVGNKAGNSIQRNAKMIPDLEKVIEELKKMGTIATALQDNHAAIEYQITSTVDQEERQLLVADLKLPEIGDNDPASKTSMHRSRDHLQFTNPIGPFETYGMRDEGHRIFSSWGSLVHPSLSRTARSYTDLHALLVAEIPMEESQPVVQVHQH